MHTRADAAAVAAHLLLYAYVRSFPATTYKHTRLPDAAAVAPSSKSPDRGPFWLSWGTTERRLGGVGGRNALHADGMREELAIAAGFAALLLGGCQCASMERGGISKKNVEIQLSR